MGPYSTESLSHCYCMALLESLLNGPSDYQGLSNLARHNSNASQPCVRFGICLGHSSLITRCHTLWNFTLYLYILVFSKDTRGFHENFWRKGGEGTKGRRIKAQKVIFNAWITAALIQKTHQKKGSWGSAPITIKAIPLPEQRDCEKGKTFYLSQKISLWVLVSLYQKGSIF